MFRFKVSPICCRSAMCLPSKDVQGEVRVVRVGAYDVRVGAYGVRVGAYVNRMVN